MTDLMIYRWRGFLGERNPKQQVQTPPTRENGFTLLELMAALVVGGILMSIAVPSMRTMMMNNRMATQTNAFLTAMSLARSEAIKRGVTIDVVATNTTDTTNEWGDGWEVKVDGGATIRKFPALDSSSALNSTGDKFTYQYQASGRITPTDTLYLCDNRTGETGRQMSIAATGHVTISNHTCS